VAPAWEQDSRCWIVQVHFRAGARKSHWRQPLQTGPRRREAEQDAGDATETEQRACEGTSHASLRLGSLSITLLGAAHVPLLVALPTPPTDVGSSVGNQSELEWKISRLIWYRSHRIADEKS
jgi:hypothetical protein